MQILFEYRIPFLSFNIHLHGNSDFESLKLGPYVSGSAAEETLFIEDLVGKLLRVPLLKALKYKKILIYDDTG